MMNKNDKKRNGPLDFVTYFCIRICGCPTARLSLVKCRNCTIYARRWYFTPFYAFYPQNRYSHPGGIDHRCKYKIILLIYRRTGQRKIRSRRNMKYGRWFSCKYILPSLCMCMARPLQVCVGVARCGTRYGNRPGDLRVGLVQA